jgi:hypothetical protein
VQLKSFRLNFILFFGLFFTAGVIILVASFFAKQTLILKPESKEEIAKRFAPENAFFTLKEAKSLMPQNPSFLMAPGEGDDKFVQKYKPRKGSLGSISGVERPDNDPLLLDYLMNSTQAIAKAKEALNHPYFLCPTDFNKAHTQDHFEYDYSCYQLSPPARVMVARGVQSFRSGDEAAAITNIIDGVKIVLLLRSDGGLFVTRINDLVVNLLSCSNELLTKASDSTLEKFQSEIYALRDRVQTPTHEMEFFFRSIVTQNPWAYSDQEAPLIQKAYIKAVDAYQIQSIRVQARRQMRELLDLTKRPYPEFYSWFYGPTHDNNKNSHVQYKGFLADQAFYRVRNYTEIVASINASTLTIAIERAHRATGVYPETLDSLSPRFIAELPQDPFTGKSFIYIREGDSYQLYSIGGNLTDDTAGKQIEIEEIHQGDDLIYHWSKPMN